MNKREISRGEFGEGGRANCGGSSRPLESGFNLKYDGSRRKILKGCDLTQITLKIPVACYVENRLQGGSWGHRQKLYSALMGHQVRNDGGIELESWQQRW